MNRYKNAMDKVHFSEDIESRILLSIEKKESGLRTRKRDFSVIAGLLVGCAAAMLILIMLADNGRLKSDFISIENVEEIPYVEKVQDIMVTLDEGKYSIESLNIESGEMVIFSLNTGFEEGVKSLLKGEFTGTNLCYNIGYIYEGKYYEIRSDLKESSVTENIFINQTGDYYWCVVNTSTEKMLFTGNIQILAKDLLFRDYGSDAIVVDRPCVFVINGINFDETEFDETMRGIYVYNHQTQQTTMINYNMDMVYKVNEPGAYTIYTFNKEGGIINLKDFVTVGYEADEHSGPILL